jgi:hypothetical protein
VDRGLDFIENRIFDEIRVGDGASLQRTLTPRDIQLFAVMSGDVNPAHVDAEYAKNSVFHEVIAPTEKVRRPRTQMPEVRLHDPAARYQQLIARAKGMPALATAVIHPCDRESLGGALTAAEAGLIRPVLIGPMEKIQAVARELQVDLSPYEIVHAPHSHDAAALGVEYARNGHVAAIMKGSLHTDEMMAAVRQASCALAVLISNKAKGAA